MSVLPSSNPASIKPRLFPGKPIIIRYTPKHPTTTTTTTTTSTTLIALEGGQDSFLKNSTVEVFSSTFNTTYSTSTNAVVRNNRDFDYDVDLCAPFPPCNPLGCGPGKAPVDCDECNSAGVAFVIFGMCLLAILIAFTNVLVIAILSRNPSLRRRHGYIKISLAAADLLIGILVIPAAIYNMATTLYIPTPNQQLELRSRFWRLETKSLAVTFTQKNKLASVFFGTVLIISLTSSIYNLLLLSIDRLLAVAKPLQSRSGKYLNKKRLRISLFAIWFFGLFLSCLPAFIPSRFSYQLDGTTFFYILTVNADSPEGVVPYAFFSLFVMGLPYIAIVVINFTTLAMTIKKLQFSRRHSTKGGKNSRKGEQAKRMKLILESCPEMKHEGQENRLQSWGRSCLSSENNSNNNPGKLARERVESVSSVLSKAKSLKQSAEKLNARVSKMIVTMVVAFSVCICPYIIVNVLLASFTLTCLTVGTVYNIATYLVFLNSGMNFFIYNFWHTEFRAKLKSALARKPSPRSSRPTSSTRSGIAMSAERPKFSSPLQPTFARQTASKYHAKKAGANSYRRGQSFEMSTKF